jgi:hypothetical protein
MNPSDPDKPLREMIAKAFVPPDLCAEDNESIEAMLNAADAEADPFTDEQVDRILKKARGSCPSVSVGKKHPLGRERLDRG